MECNNESEPINYQTQSIIPLAVDIAFGPDGQLFILSNLSEEGLVVNYFVAEIDSRNEKFRSILFTDTQPRSGDNFISLGSKDNNKLIAVVEDSIFYISVLTGEVLQKNKYDGLAFVPDICTIADTLYSTSGSDNFRGVLSIHENSITQIADFTNSGDGIVSGIGTVWAEDCSEKQLVMGWYERPSSSETLMHMQVRRPNGELVREACPIYTADAGLRETFFGHFWGIASYDNYITVCELRLDLDDDDSGSRYGPHFWQDTRCGTPYAIADDVSLRSLVGALDSVTVRLRSAASQQGHDRLVAPTTDRLLVRNFGDTVLHLVATGQTTDADFLELLPQITLDATAPVIMPGERVVETFAFAGGLRSDQARTFVQVTAGGGAGRDTSVVVCPGDTLDLFAALGPEAVPGGSWFPQPAFPDRWVPDVDFYDVPYEYRVTPDGCPEDLAFITVRRPTSIIADLPITDTTIDLCPGKAFFWDVDVPAVGTVVWDDGTSDRVRDLRNPGTYTGTITATAGCPTENISLTIVNAPSGNTTLSNEWFCEGDTIMLADGSLLAYDSIVPTNFTTGPWSCDSLHLTFYRFREREVLDLIDTLCMDDKIILRDQVFEEPGEYSFVVPGGNCDTLINFTLLPALVDTIRVDTTLPEGEVLDIAGQTFGAAGAFSVLLPTEGTCGIRYLIDLDFSTSNRHLAATYGLWYPTLLRAGADAFSLRPYDPAVTAVATEELNIFDAHGRLVGERSNESFSPDGLAAGIYFFRARVRVNNRPVEIAGRFVLSR